jgi:P27 family predicted phage terminase small subunit
VKGRKPKPIEQREREGNPGNRNLPEPLRTSEAGARVAAPVGLPADAIELWDEVVTRLSEVGVLDRVDRGALIAMCTQWARSVTAGRVVAQEGFFALGSMGQLVEHPALAIERQSHALFLRFAEQYALTPSARARVAAVMSARHTVAELDSIIGADPIELDE